MRLTGCMVIVLLFYAKQAQGQFTKSVPLKPIYKQDWKYYYGGRKVHSVYALQIPLQELDNKEINERFRKFRKYRALGALAYLPSLVFLLTNDHLRGGHYGFRSRNSDTRTLLFLVAGGIGGNVAFNALGHRQLNQAIDLYNIQIAEKSTLGISLNRLPRANLLGLSYSLRF